MKLLIYIYPSNEPIIIKWICVPRIGESIYIQGALHKVTDVWHNFVTKDIKVRIGQQ